MRTEIKNFAKEMERVMAENDEVKGDTWEEMQIFKLDERLKYSLNEYEGDKRRNSWLGDWENMMAKDLVDISNYCMMLWNRLRK